MSSVKEDKDLWSPGGGGGGNPAKSAQVRALYVAHIGPYVEADTSNDPHGHQRVRFCRDGTLVCDQEELRKPGEVARAPIAPGRERVAEAIRKQVDAMHTHLRWFVMGNSLPDFELLVIETTIHVREGKPLPGKAYETQVPLVKNDTVEYARSLDSDECPYCLAFASVPCALHQP